MSGWETPIERWKEWLVRDGTLEHPVWVSCDEFDDHLRELLESRPFTNGQRGRAHDDGRPADPANPAAESNDIPVTSSSSALEGSPSTPTIFGANGSRTAPAPAMSMPSWSTDEPPAEGAQGGPSRSVEATPEALLSEPELEGLFIPTLTRSALAFAASEVFPEDEGLSSELSDLEFPGVEISPSSALEPSHGVSPAVVPPVAAPVLEAPESLVFTGSEVGLGPGEVAMAELEQGTEAVDAVQLVPRSESESAIELDEAELVEEHELDAGGEGTERKVPPAPPPVARDEGAHTEGAAAASGSETESALAALQLQRDGVTSTELEERIARQPAQGRSWYDEVFAEHYAALTRPSHGKLAKAEIDFFLSVSGLTPGARVLDVGCGDGVHAIALAQRGFDVTALDLSASQLLRASKASEALHTPVRWLHCDMRSPSLDPASFDGLVCLGTSFGYFDEDENRKLLSLWRDLLVPRGRALIQVVNRDHVLARLPARSWWQGRGCLVLDEAEMDFFTNRMQVLRNIAFNDGRQLKHDMSIRVYSAYELGHMCASAGLRVLEISGSRQTRGRFFGATSPEIWLLLERALS